MCKIDTKLTHRCSSEKLRCTWVYTTSAPISRVAVAHQQHSQLVKLATVEVSCSGAPAAIQRGTLRLEPTIRNEIQITRKTETGAKLDFKELPAEDVFHPSYRSTQAGECWTNVLYGKDNVRPRYPEASARGGSRRFGRSRLG
ncbi:hypothetical protein R1flu_001817 [Riccia fluitans]|uniref:Uncharacterized protein n=1 Tax=Riccia fluitans TaxID=41844 RepID=A0ABD1Y4F0_9MARC